MEAQKPVAAEQKPTTSGVPKGGWWFVAIFAVVVFIGFGILVGYMAMNADTKDKTEWSNLVFLFTSVEAIVFAAGAFIFGREINRGAANASTQRANTAEKQKTEAEKEALQKEAEAKKQLERGQTVANMFRAQSTGREIGAMKTDDDSPEMNGFLKLLDEWYPKK